MLKVRIVPAARWQLVLYIMLAVCGFGMAGGLAVPAVAVAQSARVADIRVVGNRRVEPETVRSYLQFSVGDAYDAGKVDGSLKALFSTGLFSDVRIDRDGAAVVVTVVENPIINQVAFEGNSEIDNAALQAEVQLKPRSVFTRAKAQGDVQRILDLYRRQGRFAASVEPKLIEIEQNRVNLVYEITEGNATKVKGIHFVGNHAFSDQQLRDIISTTQQGWFDFLKGTSVYDPDRNSLDRELLRQYYQKNGYADVRVVASNAELDRDGSGFYITFAVDEGLPYSFGAMNVESSLPGVNPDGLSGGLLTVSGATYNASLIDKTVEKLTLRVSELGFAFVRVRPKAVPDLASHTIGITYTIEEGPRVYIERINIIGNARTKDYVIRREFRLAEGDAYNPLLVDRAKVRLQALGLFKTVEIKKKTGSAQDRVILDVELIEQPTGELSFGAGYSTLEGVIGDVGITERNFLGNGQFLRLKLAGSFQRLQADLSFTEPHFLDTNVSAGFDLFAKRLDQTLTSGFLSSKFGGSLRLGVPVAESLFLQAYYTLSRDEIYGLLSDGGVANANSPTGAIFTPSASRAVQQACGFNNTTGNCDAGAYYTSLVGTSITYDQRNHPTNPNKGYFLQAGVDFAGLGGSVQYIRGSAEARGYYPIADKVTFVTRVTGGTIQGWGGQDVKLLDLFFQGGETVRGFQLSGYGPRDTLSLNGDALGGTTYWAATAEVRFPIPGIPDDLGVSAAAFVDAGSLFGVSNSVLALNNCNGTAANNICLQGNDASVRSSVGASILWTSPVGPLRMDFAQTITRNAVDITQFFRFGASTRF